MVRNTEAQMFRVTVGRFDEPVKTVSMERGETVAQMLDKASITLNTGEKVKDSSAEELSTNDAVEAGEEYFIVSSYKSGN